MASAPTPTVAHASAAAPPAGESPRVAPPPPALAVTPSAGAPPAAAAAPSAGSPADPNAALFAEAHRLHFVERNPSRALAAWDRYLAAAEGGRFAPEARYNRALALVRLGRTAEATRELETFASGTYGSYRREEAKALLRALARDAAP